ncbi:hypothetical protein E2562_004750 [Oryza meyeriana var. granulata]|uniref:Uncharacterized protein n=1 Tax=Oryza meyeriana var. granulata TaxID=110450 RepID=A0A6G1DEZ6_9ORYZ|nr:hypothetical protein E2562_004750 [Oryza meyeriana var. granulata]
MSHGKLDSLMISMLHHGHFSKEYVLINPGFQAYGVSGRGLIEENTQERNVFSRARPDEWTQNPKSTVDAAINQTITATGHGISADTRHENTIVSRDDESQTPALERDFAGEFASALSY